MIRAPFKYTIPITRASSQDGELFLEGEASGPELDTWGTRIDPALVENFAVQIMERAATGDPIPYRDTHGMGITNDNGVMADLGELVAAGLTDDQHLQVRVRLDRENPAARYLHLQIQRGKRYGMSIGGTVVDYVDEYVDAIQQVVRTFKSVILDHIANTSQPAWTPSLGTVLTRAVERALEGENMDPEEVLAPTPEDEGAQESEAPEPVAEEVTEEEVAEVEEVAVEAEAEEAEVEDEAAEPVVEDETSEPDTVQASALQPIADAVAALAAAVSALMAGTAPVALARSEEPNDAARSVESESPVAENDENAVMRAAIESLRAELAEANDRIRQLEDEPAGNEPQVIERSETSLREELSKLDPHQRLVLGLEAAKAATK